MYNEFKNNKNIFLNNFALGDKNEEKHFNIMAKQKILRLIKLILVQIG